MKWRDLSAIDAAALAEICVTQDPYKTLGYRAQTLLAYLTRPDPALQRHALLTGDRVVGVLCRRLPWLRGPLIEMLALVPDAQGQGLGARTIARCQHEAGNNLWATVSAFHHPARRFYSRLGFQELCPLDGLVVPSQTEILLRWQKPSLPSENREP